MTIRSMHDAVQIIGQAVRVADLAPDAGGAFELVFFDQLPVYFQVVGDSEMEVQLRLGESGQQVSGDLAEALLAANLTLRHGRLAMEPGRERLVYCGRINTAHHDSKTLVAAVTAIIREGAALRLEGFAALLRDAEGRHSTENMFSDSLIRV